MTDGRTSGKWVGSVRARAVIASFTVAAGLLPVGAAALSPEKAVTQYSLRAWKDELPQSTVHTIAQTRDGYLWLGTYEGLVRFDGVEFDVFDSVRTKDIPGTSVYDLHEDDQGRLWIATSGGLTVLEGGEFTSLTVEDGLLEPIVRRVMSSGSDVYAAGSERVSLLREERFIDPLAGWPGSVGTIADLAIDSDGRLWIAGSTGVVRVGERSIESFGVADGLPSANVRDLLVHDGVLWVGTDDGLARLEGDRFRGRDLSGLGDRSVRRVLVDRDDNLWIGTNSGLLRGSGEQWSRLDESNGLTHDAVRSLFEDREGVLWVGTSGGLTQLRDGKFLVYGVSEGLSGRFARTVMETSDGSIWVGTDGDGVDVLAPDGVWRHLGTEDGLSNGAVLAMAEDRAGGVWLGTRAGVDVWRDGEISAVDLGGAVFDSVRAIARGEGGLMWIGTEGAGLLRWVDGIVTRLTTADGLAGNDVRDLLRASDGCLWVATFGGLSCLRDGRVESFGTEDGLSVEIVFELHEDSEGQLWVGTDNGLNLFRDGRFEVFRAEDGLFDNKVFRILEDDDGYLWMSSNRGLSRVSRRNLIALADGVVDRVGAVGYTTADGMPANQVNGASQPAGWRARDGRLWFPTAAGVVVVDPNRMRSNELSPPIHIQRVTIDEVDVELDRPFDRRSPVSVGAGTQRFEFHYAALSFVAPQKVSYRYQLLGFDDDWVEAGNRRTAYYTNIPPGSYEFRVIASNNDGVWNEDEAGFAFELATSLWRTWWASVLYVVALFGSVGFAVRWRIERLRRQNVLLERKVAQRTALIDEKSLVLAQKVQELEESEQRAVASQRRALEANRAKTMFLSNMSHELRTPLNSIIGFAAVLQERLPREADPRAVRFVENILSSGKHLLGLINDLLDLSKVEAGRMSVAVEAFHVESTLRGVRNVMRGVAQEREINLDLDVDSATPEIYADLLKFKQIMFNLMSNAIKFSEDGGTVTIRVRCLGTDDDPLYADAVEIDVIDHGIGIPSPQLETIFDSFSQVDGAARRYQGTGLGLALVKRLTEIQGGRVRVVSQPGQGSTFSVFLPVRVDALEASQPLPERPELPARSETDSDAAT